MGRARERRLTPRGATTRQRIVEAAADLVHLKGAERVSLDDVMEATGASRSQLYHYFDDKEGLVRDVIAFQTRRILDANAAHLGRLDSHEALRAWGEMLIAANRAGVAMGCPLGSLAGELAAWSEDARHQLEGSFAAWAALIEAGLRRMKDAGRLESRVDPASLSLAFLAAIQGGILLSKVARDSRALELALDMALGHIERHATATGRA